MIKIGIYTISWMQSNFSASCEHLTKSQYNRRKLRKGITTCIIRTDHSVPYEYKSIAICGYRSKFSGSIGMDISFKRAVEQLPYEEDRELVLKGYTNFSQDIFSGEIKGKIKLQDVLIYFETLGINVPIPTKEKLFAAGEWIAGNFLIDKN